MTTFTFGKASLLALASLAFSTSAIAAPGNVAAGQLVFKSQCGICHAVIAGKNGVGPSLAKIVGRKPGSLTDFVYSAPMKAKAGLWDAAALDRFISKPMVAVPGTRMAFVGQGDPVKRANLVAYLASLK